MISKDVRDRLEEENPEALFADGFDAALVGVSHRCGQPSLAVYDIDMCIGVLIDQGMSGDNAEEFFWVNVAGDWMGDHTPLFVQFNFG